MDESDKPNIDALGLGAPPVEVADGEWPPWFEKWVVPFVSESAMWPVLFALLAHVFVGVGALLLYVVRDGKLSAAAALSILVMASIRGVWFEIQYRKRLGGLTGMLVILWLLSALAAWGAGALALL